MIPHNQLPCNVMPHDVTPHNMTPHEQTPHEAMTHNRTPHNQTPHDQTPRNVMPPPFPLLLRELYKLSIGGRTWLRPDRLAVAASPPTQAQCLEVTNTHNCSRVSGPAGFAQCLPRRPF